MSLAVEKSDYIHYIPATELAEYKIGNSRTANTIIIGYLLKFMPIERGDIIKSLEKNFSQKILDINIKALDLGVNYEEN